MKKLTLLLSLLLTLAAWTAQAQDHPAKLDKAKSATREKLQTREQLPEKLPDLEEEARLAREAGIPDQDLKMVMNEARERKLSHQETGAILRESRLACELNGPIDNLGAFVKTRLDEGLRGPDLARAIQEEHKLHGKGQAAREKAQKALKAGQEKARGEAEAAGELKARGQGQMKKKGDGGKQK